MAKKKSKSVSIVYPRVVDPAASGSPIFGTNLSFLASLPIDSARSGLESSPLAGSGSAAIAGSGSGSVSVRTVTGPGSSSGPSLPSVEVSPSAPQSSLPPMTEVHRIGTGVGAVQFGSIPGEAEASQAKNYAALLKSSAQLQELGTPVEHVSGAPFVLIPDENIEAAKREFKDFIYARFHGDYPSIGKIIGVVNANWARQGPKIFVHNIGQGIYLLRVTNPRTREVLLSRTCWNIGGLPMFVAPWSPDYSPEEPPLTSAIVPVEMRNVLLFNQESLSRIATAVGKPDSLAPETERKLNFEVAKLYVRVDFTAPLPNKIVSGFSNGK